MTTLPTGNPGSTRGQFMRDMGLGTGLIPTGDAMSGPAASSALAKPPAGEATFQQGIAGCGNGMGVIPGFMPPPLGSYIVYRRMSAHPTLALAKSIVTAPIMASTWSYEVRRPDGKPTRNAPIGDGPQTDPIDRRLADRKQRIQRMLDPMRSPFLWEALRALEHGWRPFEKIWEIVDGEYTLRRLKSLLPDFTWCFTDKWGNFAGLSQMDAQMGTAKAYVYTYDGEAGHLYGRSRHENCRADWHRSLEVDKKSEQLATKAAAIIPQVHYPIGEGVDASGNKIDNYEIAKQILNGLSTGKGVTIPNNLARSDDPRLAAENAGKSAWVIDFLEAAGAAGNLAGMTDLQKYYDQRMFSGWLRSPRTGMESQQAGSRADSEQHTDTGMTDSDLVHAGICESLSANVVDDILVLNDGPDAKGTVYVTPAPLQDSKRAILSELFKDIWSNPQALAESVRNINMDAAYDLMELPKASEKVQFNPAALIPAKPETKPEVKPGDTADESNDEAALSRMLSRFVGDGE